MWRAFLAPKLVSISTPKLNLTLWKNTEALQTNVYQEQMLQLLKEMRNVVIVQLMSFVFTFKTNVEWSSHVYHVVNKLTGEAFPKVSVSYFASAYISITRPN